MSDVQPLAGAAPAPAEAEKRTMLQQLRANPRVPAMIGAAVAVALGIALYLWSRAPDYKVLYSNLSDRDGGAIITALQAMNVPYQLSETGNAILVPSNMVADSRLRLALQGLPKGGSVGFELMDNEKFGISQFAEQLNYQRGLEGELERTISSIASVESARVHLAIPKPSVFVREQRNPSASVLVNLYPGRVLDDAQVSAIAHMVASGVPDMPLSNVTIVDQNGNLLSAPNSGNGLDASQLKYVKQIEDDAQQRIQTILAPLYGAGNVRAQVSADIDFSQAEQTAETYAPNPTPASSTVRSQQLNEASDVGARTTGGVPGALSNAPPLPASAPLQNPAPASGASAASSTQGPVSVRKDVTTNYEVDKTIRHVQQPMGGIRRLSVAVVINYRRQVDANGHAQMVPLNPLQLAQTEQLVKDAMGFDAARGDVVNVVNSTFSTGEEHVGPELPFWKQPDNIDYAKAHLKYVVYFLIALYLYFGLWRPSMKKLFKQPAPAAPAEPALPTSMELDEEGHPIEGGAEAMTEEEAAQREIAVRQQSAYERNLQAARQLAKEDPRIVATVLKTWVSDER
jgi:flagellar M-ring protein FliF